MTSSQEITKERFGTSKDGKEIYIFTLKSDNITVRILNFGCVIKDICVPDRDGKIADVCLGYDTFDGYEENPAYLGAICGRVANRIDGATFELDGTRYNVSKNDPLGNNMCHGGFAGLTRRCFDWAIDGSKLRLKYTDADGSEGFPGDLSVSVTYELTAESGLMVDYQATTSKPTPVDLSNHFMVNLSGHAGGFIGDHVVNMNTKKILEFNDKYIPTGKISNVEGTVLDLQKPTTLCDVLEKLPGGHGLCHAHLLPGKKGDKKFVARAHHPASGRYLEVNTTEPLFISYSCFFLDFLLKSTKCKGDVVYEKSGGLLFMPQGFPDAVNQHNLPSCILRPGETYKATSWYKFGVAK